MASSSIETDENNKEQNDDDIHNWLLARQGIQLLINNKYSEAEALFLKHTDSLVMYSGYSFATFMDALMTLEDEKINLAIHVLNEVERRCNAESVGWLKSVKVKVFGNTTDESNTQNLINNLENQIILADSQMCQAILIVLNADLSGYLKSGWILRKSWKIYQSVYRDILQIYRSHFRQSSGCLDFLEELESQSSPEMDNLEVNPNWDPIVAEPFLSSSTTTVNVNGYKLPSSKSAILSSKTTLSSSGDSSPNSMKNNYANNSTRSSITSLRFLKKSASINSALVSKSKESWSQKLSPFTSSLSLAYFTSTFHFSSNDKLCTANIDKPTIKRLMSAVCFGYGLFQLGVSLLPPSLLKVTNFLGFGGNRDLGIECLMFSRGGVDMRAPLATLSLLWYHTIVRPFYALDGNNVQAGVDAATQLLQEMEKEYNQSALYLYFKGRVERLNSNIPEAIKSFQASVENASQREIKILALHDVGWCHLIQLDFNSGESIFLYLKSKSRWSRSFYTYVSAICKGANNNFDDSYDIDELKNTIVNARKGNQLDEFLMRRSKLFPKLKVDIKQMSTNYFKLLIYEMLYLWNALPSCSLSNIEIIMADCDTIIKENSEPMVGLAYLILGYCYSLKRNTTEATSNFQECLNMRKLLPNNVNDAHISAFAQYELGTALMRNEETKDESKTIFQLVSNYKNYDFEQRLNIRVHSILKTF